MGIHGQLERTFTRTLLGEEYITLWEAAALLATNERTIEQLAHEMKLPLMKTGRRWHIAKGDFEKLTKTYWAKGRERFYDADEGELFQED